MAPPMVRPVLDMLPALPGELARLQELAHNLFWVTHPAATRPFELLDPALWRATRNPVRVLYETSEARFAEAARDAGFLAALADASAALEGYLGRATWYAAQDEARFLGADFRVAYFSAEFGLSDCLPFYAGGLGILAGDHLRSASDLGVPLVGVGLAYQEGYLSQALDAEGWQEERYPPSDFRLMPMSLCRSRPSGPPVTITVDFPGRAVRARIWRVQVGRVPLFLLDTNLPENRPEDRHVTHRLYGGDREMRIAQELVLGVGGVRALHALGLAPTVCHMNEGHAGFLGLEQARRLVAEHRLSYEEARQAVAASNVFTTHTPVPAGFDTFTPALVEKYFGRYVRELGITVRELLRLGREVDEPEAPLNMAVLAMRHAALRNGVSVLHGEVTRRLVKPLWRDFPVDEVPVGSVTNGVHLETWLGPELRALLLEHGGTGLLDDPADPARWAAVDAIPDAELWAAHRRAKAALVAAAGERGGVLDPDAIVVGFARRFASYKRADLVLSDLERIGRLIASPERPLQLVFAGKAHPQDREGKAIMQRVARFVREQAGRVVFLEDYDFQLARLLVQGVDVWLNNPRRPLEASGTSGMKVLANGGLNLSILDGWWDEAYAPGLGWAIGGREEHPDPVEQDRREAEALYHVLEEEVLPLYYTRDADGLPRGWIAMMKRSMRALCPRFNTTRMVREYASAYYLPAAQRARALSSNGERGERLPRLKALVAWRERVFRAWPEVAVAAAAREGLVEARVRLGALEPADVRVDVVLAEGARPVPMTYIGAAGGEHGYEFRAEIAPRDVAVRVLPSHPDALVPHELDLICWSRP